ncbi:MAG TPA: PP2C family protein-serine/threonine phosphatase [Pirellulales bacterium]|nr:PP2C family protein-serine/threonine phosphatase [Pirellulales bacterium]
MGRSLWYALRRWYRACVWRFRQVVYWPRRRWSRAPAAELPDTTAQTAESPQQTAAAASRSAVHRIRCAEVWGGIRNAELEAVTSGVRASLFSNSCEGGEGGDVYYFSVCGADSLTRVALADVTGHGQMVSQVGRWLYDALAARMNSVRGDRVLSELNDLAEHYGFAAVSTLAVAQFYRRNSQLYVSYAGHPPALVYLRSKGRWQPAIVPEEAGLVNLPIGVSDETRYAQHAMPLASGDRVLLYTDGVLEAPGPDQSLFGHARLLSVVEQNAGAPLAELRTAIVDALRRHTGGPLTHDDVTVLALEVI